MNFKNLSHYKYIAVFTNITSTDVLLHFSKKVGNELKGIHTIRLTQLHHNT